MGEEEEKKEEEKEEEEKSDKMVKLWRSGRFQRDYTINDPSVTCGSLGKVAGSDGQEFTSTNENAAEVKAAVGVKEAPEVNTPERHPRPLARARERRRQRLAQEESQRYRDLLQSVWEKDRRGDRCKTCNNEFTESDWSNFRRLGWDVQLISRCMTCIDLDECEL